MKTLIKIWPLGEKMIVIPFHWFCFNVMFTSYWYDAQWLLMSFLKSIYYFWLSVCMHAWVWGYIQAWASASVPYQFMNVCSTRSKRKIILKIISSSSFGLFTACCIYRIMPVACWFTNLLVFPFTGYIDIARKYSVHLVSLAIDPGRWFCRSLSPRCVDVSGSCLAMVVSVGLLLLLCQRSPSQ